MVYFTLESPRVQTALKEAPSASANIHNLFEAMHGGIRGLGTEENVIFRLLANRSTAEITAIRSGYAAHYGRNLDSEIKSELSGNELARAQAYLQGDNAKGNALGIREALNEKNFNTAIEVIALDQNRSALTEAFRQLTGQGISEYAGQFLSKDSSVRDIAVNFSEAQTFRALKDIEKNATGLYYQNRFIEACHAGNLEAASAVISHPEFTNVRKLLDRQGQSDSTLTGFRPGSAISLTASRYVVSGGKSQIASNDFSGLIAQFPADQADFLEAQAEGDKAKMAASTIKILLNKPGFDKNDILAINSLLANTSAEERTAIANCYSDQSKFKIQADLRGKLGEQEFARTERIIRNGKLSDAEDVYFAVTLRDPAGRVNNLLAQQSRADIQNINDFFQTRGLLDLNMAIHANYDGRECFVLSQAARGQAASIEESIERLNERKNFEFSRLTNAFSDKDRLVDQRFARLNEDFRQIKASGQEPDRERALRLIAQIAFAGQDLDSYVNAKDGLANIGPATVAGIAGAACIILSDGLMLPVIAAGAGGGVSYYGTKRLIEGQAYQSSNYQHDFLLGAINGVSALGGMKVGGAVAGRTLTFLKSGTLAAAARPISTTLGGMANGASASISIAGLESLAVGASLEETLERMRVAGLLGFAIGAGGEAVSGGLRFGLSSGLKQLSSKVRAGITSSENSGFEQVAVTRQEPIHSEYSSVQTAGPELTFRTASIPEHNTSAVAAEKTTDWIIAAKDRNAERMHVIIKAYYMGKHPTHLFSSYQGTIIPQTEGHLIAEFVERFSSGKITSEGIQRRVMGILAQDPLSAHDLNAYRQALQTFEQRLGKTPSPAPSTVKPPKETNYKGSAERPTPEAIHDPSALLLSNRASSLLAAGKELTPAVLKALQEGYVVVEKGQHRFLVSPEVIHHENVYAPMITAKIKGEVICTYAGTYESKSGVVFVEKAIHPRSELRLGFDPRERDYYEICVENMSRHIRTLQYIHLDRPSENWLANVKNAADDNFRTELHLKDLQGILTELSKDSHCQLSGIPTIIDKIRGGDKITLQDVLSLDNINGTTIAGTLPIYDSYAGAVAAGSRSSLTGRPMQIVGDNHSHPSGSRHPSKADIGFWSSSHRRGTGNRVPEEVYLSDKSTPAIIWHTLREVLDPDYAASVKAQQEFPTYHTISMPGNRDPHNLSGAFDGQPNHPERYAGGSKTMQYNFEWYQAHKEQPIYVGPEILSRIQARVITD